MPVSPHRKLLYTGLVSAFLVLSSCGGGGGNSSQPSQGSPSPTPTGSTPTPTPPQTDIAFSTEESTSRFLTQATFGPERTQSASLMDTSASQWFIDQLNRGPSLHLPIVRDFIQREIEQGTNEASFIADLSPRFAFLKNAIDGDDQLRQRVTFALSQIFVVSDREPILSDRPLAMGSFQDTLTTHAFGNYRELLEEVTYSPAMGVYLTYLGNKKANPNTGRMPDENYAREVMQLFSIGLVELNPDGSEKMDSSGEAIETYTNDDISGLARVFTGLSMDREKFGGGSGDTRSEELTRRMIGFPEQHSSLEKSFLGTTIPADTDLETSISTALDTLANHPNTAPFISRQLIQRLVTSHPSPQYIERVSSAFTSGTYTLPDGRTVGESQYGDLAATVAAILFDTEARSETNLTSNNFGKLREPVIRFIHWARAFNVQSITPEYLVDLFDTGELGQQAYGSPSVFNFYRPGYVAPGTRSGQQNLTTPEFQIVNATNVANYVGFLQKFVEQSVNDRGSNKYASEADIRNSFRTDYSAETALADTPQALLDHLDALLTSGQMSSETKQGIIDAISNITVTDASDPTDEGIVDRTHLAVLLVLTSPDYIVQR